MYTQDSLFNSNELLSIPCETPTKEPYGISNDLQFSPPKASQRGRTRDL